APPSQAAGPAHPVERIACILSLGPLTRRDLPERLDADPGEKQLAPHPPGCLFAHVVKGAGALAVDPAEADAPILCQGGEQEVLREHLAAVASGDGAVEGDDEGLLRYKDGLLVFRPRAGSRP